MDSVLEQFRSGHEELDRLKRAAANELSRSATTVSQSMSITAPFFFPSLFFTLSQGAIWCLCLIMLTHTITILLFVTMLMCAYAQHVSISSFKKDTYEAHINP